MKLLLIMTAVASASAGRLDHLTGGAGAAFGEATRFENVNDGAGNYHFSYETPNGISARESGAPRAAGSEGPAVTAEGAFSYRAPDGQQVSLTYTADENGFHPVGSHLPTPPPIPEAILKALEFNRQNPSSAISHRDTMATQSQPAAAYTLLVVATGCVAMVSRDDGSYNGGRSAYRF